MTMPLFVLSELSRSFLSLCFLLLCLIGIFSIVLSVSQKRYRLAVSALFPLVCNYFLWQVLFDIHLYGDTKDATAISREFGNIPFVYWLLSLVILTFAAVFILIRVNRYGKRSVTPAAVKLCLDQMPCGVCCWRDSGRVLFSNICMNRLCADLTGSPLLDGNQFYRAVSGGICHADGKVWRFSFRDIDFDGEHTHEMIASDISTEYAKTQTLENDKAELSRLNRELAEYTLNIDDTVRRQEIMQAKVNIHDEMNRLMLSTMAAGDDAAALDRIFSLWEQNALLLCMEANEIAVPQAANRIVKLAEALKIRLNWDGGLPDALNEKQQSLFFSAAQEAITNAAKHADANVMTVSFDDSGDSLSCRFINDGKMPTGNIRFAGGLANLALLAERQGASVFAEVGENFTLILRFAKKHIKNQPNG